MNQQYTRISQALLASKARSLSLHVLQLLLLRSAFDVLAVSRARRPTVLSLVASLSVLPALCQKVDDFVHALVGSLRADVESPGCDTSDGFFQQIPSEPIQKHVSRLAFSRPASFLQISVADSAVIVLRSSVEHSTPLALFRTGG